MLRTSQKFYLFWKRCIDIFGSFLGIVLLSPILITCAIVTKCTSKGPVFFKQERLGYHEKPFTILKFRSMRVDAPQIGAESMTPAEQAALLTKWGAFMRKTSLDEFPQLFNIFVGQMSFIGPRPCMSQNSDALTKARENVRPSAYEVKPGLSGYAQIHLHREHDPMKKALADAYYVAHFSFWMDIKLFFASIFGVFGEDKGR
jgi:lipopolysaccharide/colanic/teichoic acid biosynthesis glycosyltransferase